ncbi:glycosyltransferase family 2 protein [Bacillus sp. V3-13]|uniref:glycosyltransferase family 2 protein n=1 Tax=Bacillus sp. V3-13 TaxID=2053728 RepID=UPI0015E086D9|nr:glycosyltransferase family 2 protein [Bacillus sp. V3-13]
MSISLVMIAKNEENNLFSCLNSIKELVDELIVVDTGSNDKTKEIASDIGANVYDFEWNNDFSEARNYALAQSKSDWNLVLDADEQVIDWDVDQINSLLYSGTFIGRINIKSKFVQNNEVKESQAYISRLIPRGVSYKGRIHEQIHSDLPRIDLPIEIYHSGYYQTDKSKRNLHLLELELLSFPENPYILYQIARQYKAVNRVIEAKDYFSKSYFFANKDDSYFGDLAVNYLYTLIDTKDFTRAFAVINEVKSELLYLPDFHFVSGIFFMNFVLSDINTNISYLPRIEESYLNCLSLGEQGAREIVIGTGNFLAAYNLAVYYEMFKQEQKAKFYYEYSAQFGYQPAVNRLSRL